jgi:hypothetical protein
VVVFRYDFHGLMEGQVLNFHKEVYGVSGQIAVGPALRK